MTDTTTLAPTDAEIEAMRDAFDWDGWTCPKATQRAFARAPLAKWGAPAPERDALEKAVRKLHAAKGRYHNQIAACDLFDLLGLPNVRPGQEAAPPAQEARVPLTGEQMCIRDRSRPVLG